MPVHKLGVPGLHGTGVSPGVESAERMIAVLVDGVGGADASGGPHEIAAAQTTNRSVRGRAVMLWGLFSVGVCATANSDECVVGAWVGVGRGRVASERIAERAA